MDLTKLIKLYIIGMCQYAKNYVISCLEPTTLDIIKTTRVLFKKVEKCWLGHLKSFNFKICL